MKILILNECQKKYIYKKELLKKDIKQNAFRKVTDKYNIKIE